MSKEPPSFVVVGSGSIALRHIRNLKSISPDSVVVCVSSSGRVITTDQTGADRICSDVAAAAALGPVFGIIASPAPFHLTHAKLLLSQGIPTLIEKPLASSIEEANEFRALLTLHQNIIGVGYNLRFMPSAQELHKLLKEAAIGRVISVAANVGQYLPDWRPTTDYRQNVSAQKALGGGALRELSHELDYLTWLFGPFAKVHACSRNSGMLGIDVDDVVDAILMQEEGLVATLHLDFLQRYPQRTCTIIGESGTLVWDVFRNRIVKRSENQIETVVFDQPEYDKNDMYILQLKTFMDALKNGNRHPVSVNQGLRVLQLIDAMEQSSQAGNAWKVEGIS